MARPRIMIADRDVNYIIPLQHKFAKEFFDKIDLEIITDADYFNELFSKPQKADILIVADELYDASLQKHHITNIFVMVEQYEQGGTEELGINKLFKYSSIKEIFNGIIGKCAGALNIEKIEKAEPRIVLVTSAAGGVGKTTVAIGVAASLAQNYKRVLYINAARLQHFQHMLNNDTPIMSPEVYAKLLHPTEQIYSDIKHVIRKEGFSYLPAFKAALMSMGMQYSVYQQIALAAKKSGDYDFIIIDAESTFDEEKANFIDIADKVIVVTEQTPDGMKFTNAFLSNINGTNSEKYLFVCNKFKKETYNALIVPQTINKFTINEYVEYFEVNGFVNCEEIARISGIKKVSFLVI